MLHLHKLIDFFFFFYRMFRVKLVTFDVTGTLLQFRTSVYEQYAQAGKKFGIAADPEILKSNFKEEWRRLSEKHPNYGRFTGLLWEGWWVNMVKGTFKSYAKSHEDDVNISKTAEYLLRHFQTSQAWVVSKNAEDLLEFLKTSDVKLGIISNYDSRLHRILKALDINHYFDFVLTSYEVGCEKPDPRIFEAALKKVNEVNKEEIIHIGDDVRLDYFGAKSMGWQALLYNPKIENSEGVDARDVFRDFEEIKKYFMERIELKQTS